jgi:hypothetical protein
MQAQISLSDQKMYLYHNGSLMAVSTISTGKGGGSTPTGHFTVLDKNRYYRSKKYEGAPMPYAHWLTSKGIAMHAGNLPGYPASHGCVRLPTEFARLLFESSSIGMPVVITHNQSVAFSPTDTTAFLPITNRKSKRIKISRRLFLPKHLKITKHFHKQKSVPYPSHFYTHKRLPNYAKTIKYTYRHPLPFNTTVTTSAVNMGHPPLLYPPKYYARLHLHNAMPRN